MFLIDLIKRQLNVLTQLIDETEQKLGSYDQLPDRTLTFRTRGTGKTDYYEQAYDSGKRKLYPIGKENNDKVVAYKRQRFLREKLKILRIDKTAIENLLSSFRDYSEETVQKLLPSAYRDLSSDDLKLSDAEARPFFYKNVPATLYKDERFQDLVKWASAKYKRNPMPLPDDPNIARDGIPMRSKGECMWYDDIMFEGLPVRVEPELIIQGKSGQWHKLYPDFEFKCFSGDTILVEHFGKWDDEEYAERNKRKIQAYLDCGFVLGDNLIVTSDNVNHRTNELAIIEALEIIKRRVLA